ncbi:MAG: NAD-dependent epimerase/dehydratase family protein [Ignavibacteria bacterium]
MFTILGAGGVIANETVAKLHEKKINLKLVSRNPKKIKDCDEVFPADLTNADQVYEAVKDSEIVFLTAGLEYKAKVWEEAWPKIMENTINACKRYGAKLIFFDNVYMYGNVNGWMTEDTEIKPVSKKGEVRAEIAVKLIEEIDKQNIDAIIARSADFYGPNAVNGIINILVINKFANENNANWLLNDKVKHSFTYTKDAADALVVLVESENTWNQIWHLPTNKEVLNGKEIIETAAKYFGAEPRYGILNKFMISLAGLFNSQIRESKEMLYQYEYDYLFDSSKFEKRFNYTPISYEEGIRETIESIKTVKQYE